MNRRSFVGNEIEKEQANSLRRLARLKNAYDATKLVRLDALACLCNDEFTWSTYAQFARLPDQAIHCLQGCKQRVMV